MCQSPADWSIEHWTRQSTMTEPEKPKSEFSQIADDAEEQSLLAEFVDFLKTNKKWWLAPIIIVMLSLGVLLLLSSSAAAPFIYTLF